MSEPCKVCYINEKMLERCERENISTAFKRAVDMKPCPFGPYGTCCKVCSMGPCRINPKDQNTQTGICGARAETIAARNFARMIAAGTAAHSDHGREVAKTFLAAARGTLPGYQIKDEKKLRMIAECYEVSTSGKTKQQIAEEVGVKAIAEFGRQEGEGAFVKRAPEKRQALWRELGVAPRGVDIEVVETMHRTGMGVDEDYENIMLQGARTALADGWIGSMIATELQDIMFGTPEPLHGKVNLGVLKTDEVNIIIHGHEPLLSEVIVMAAKDKELIELAKSKGAKGINVAGVCCTANEMLLRHGVPVAGNFAQQELAIATGAVESMVVDVQCIMPGTVPVASKYHTKIVTTSRKAKIRGAVHHEFDEHNAVKVAKEIVAEAVENYPNRGKVEIPTEDVDLIAGFSHETIEYMLGGSFRASYRPLNDNIMNGRILGVAGVVGCDTPRDVKTDVATLLVKELIKNNVLVLQTGCAAISCAREDLLTPEAALEYAGAGLREVCEAVGIPPVLHSGACVDNSRLLIAATAMVKEGGLGTDISDLPVAGACPDWMNEKAIAIGQYFVASGVYTVFGPYLPTTGCDVFLEYLRVGQEKLFKGMWGVEKDPVKMAHMMIAHIRRKRQSLGIDKAQDRVLYDMEMRRQLAV